MEEEYAALLANHT
jgi:hypothetical protein